MHVVLRQLIEWELADAGNDMQIEQRLVLITRGRFYLGLLKQGLTVHLHTEDIIPMLILGLFNTGIGCYFYFSSIGKLPVQTVAICGYLEPLSAVVFSVIVLHETMLPIQILGAALIIGGAVSSELVKRKTS